MAGVLRSKGFKGYELALMFYCVCVVLRLGFAGLVWKFGEERWMLWVLLGLGCFGALMNVRGMQRVGRRGSSKGIWWSREFHLLSAVVIGVLALAGLMGWLPHLDVVRRLLVAVLVQEITECVAGLFSRGC